MKEFYKTLTKSCKAFFGNFKSVVIIMLIDIACFICTAYVYTYVWEKIMASTNIILGLMDISMEEFAEVQTEAQLQALSSQSNVFMSHYQNIGYNLGVLFVSILIFWCIFQGINWLLTSIAMNQKKEKFVKHMGKFSLLTLIWWALALLIMSLGMKLSMNASMEVLPIFGEHVSTMITLALMLVLFYFAYTSYALIPSHRMKTLFHALFKKAFEDYRVLIPAYLFTAAVLIGEYLIFMKLFMYGGTAAGIFAVVLIFPSIAWSRFYAITAVEKK
jgi:hypothetical protein